MKTGPSLCRELRGKRRPSLDSIENLKGNKLITNTNKKEISGRTEKEKTKNCVCRLWLTLNWSFRKSTIKTELNLEQHRWNVQHSSLFHLGKYPHKVLWGGQIFSEAYLESDRPTLLHNSTRAACQERKLIETYQKRSKDILASEKCGFYLLTKCGPDNCYLIC